MDIKDDERLDIINRVKRARGQLDGVLSMIEHDRTSAEVVLQMGAASTAIDRVARRLVAMSLMQCCVDADAPGAITELELEDLLLSLS
jgi:DNA-binding FrmR family transcriptional regulator